MGAGHLGQPPQKQTQEEEEAALGCPGKPELGLAQPRPRREPWKTEIFVPVPPHTSLTSALSCSSLSDITSDYTRGSRTHRLSLPNWAIMLTNVSLWSSRRQRIPDTLLTDRALLPVSGAFPPSPSLASSVVLLIKRGFLAPHGLLTQPAGHSGGARYAPLGSVKDWGPEGGMEAGPCKILCSLQSSFASQPSFSPGRAGLGAHGVQSRDVNDMEV